MKKEEYENVRSIHRVPFSKLRPEFDSGIFSFETTDNLELMPNEIIRQHLAVRAMEFGLSIEQSGYNLFVVGPTGTGRMMYTQDSVEKVAKSSASTNDWCYVYNFDNPDRPLVISLPAGNGLAVMGTRDSIFGIQTKITAQTFVGKNGIDFDRFLSGEFAKNYPIPLSASITFEQTYSNIDGDSASSTELYVLLSSLADVPIDQGIAVRSVNQWGKFNQLAG
jgi:hypothetical protein